MHETGQRRLDVQGFENAFEGSGEVIRFGVMWDRFRALRDVLDPDGLYEQSKLDIHGQCERFVEKVRTYVFYVSPIKVDEVGSRYGNAETPRFVEYLRLEQDSFISKCSTILIS